MSAETLRRAAEKLRAQATAVENTEWRTNRFFWKVESPTLADGWWWAVTDVDGDVALLSEHDDDQWDTAEQRATYIATMHPGVGLALADWLVQSADRLAKGHHSGSRHAHSVARLILGGDS